MSKNTLVITAALLILIASQTYAEKLTFNTEQSKAIETIIEEYLDKHPEAVEAALKKSLLKSQQEELKQAKVKIIKYKDQIFNDPTSPIGGNPKGTTSLTVFLDPYCGYCRRFEAVLQSVAKKEKDLKIIYKVLPILGPESLKAAREQLAANMQGKFLNYQEALYESAASNREARMVLAKNNGLDIERLKKDIKSLTVKENLKNNMSLAKILNINGTPAFIIGEELISGMVDETSLIEMLDKLKTKKSS